MPPAVEYVIVLDGWPSPPVADIARRPQLELEGVMFRSGPARERSGWVCFGSGNLCTVNYQDSMFRARSYVCCARHVSFEVNSEGIPWRVSPRARKRD